jgi:hypothetical protein
MEDLKKGEKVERFFDNFATRWNNNNKVTIVLLSPC